MQPLVRLRSLWIRTRKRILQPGEGGWGFSAWQQFNNKTIVPRCVAAILALISLASFAAAIGPWDRTFEHPTGSVRGDWQDGISIAPLAVAILHNSFHVLYRPRPQKKIPRSVELGLDFIIWAALLPGLVFAIWGGTFHLWRGENGQQLGRVLCESGTGSKARSRECFMQLYHIGSLELAGIVFAIPLWAMHVFFFAHAIVKARSQRRNWPSLKEIDMEAEKGNINININKNNNNNAETATYSQMPRRPPQPYPPPSYASRERGSPYYQQ